MSALVGRLKLWTTDPPLAMLAKLQPSPTQPSRLRIERVRLAPDDLDLMATCAYLTGRDLDFQKILQQAYHLNVAAGNQTRAARTAFWLGLTGLLRGRDGNCDRMAVARGTTD